MKSSAISLTVQCVASSTMAFSFEVNGPHLIYITPSLKHNNAGLTSRPAPQRDPIFRDAKFFCFGAINNRRNYWWGISFLSSHEKGGAFEPAGFYACQSLISIPVMVRPKSL